MMRPLFQAGLDSTLLCSARSPAPEHFFAFPESGPLFAAVVSNRVEKWSRLCKNLRQTKSEKSTSVPREAHVFLSIDTRPCGCRYFPEKSENPIRADSESADRGCWHLESSRIVDPFSDGRTPDVPEMDGWRGAPPGQIRGEGWWLKQEVV